MWEIKSFGEICDFVRGPFGGSLKKSFFKEQGYAVYEQQHAIYDQFSQVRYFVGQAKFDEMKRFELQPGDLIMSCSGTMGKIALVPEGIQQGIINQALLKLTPSKLISPYFLKYWMSSPNFQGEIERLSQGAAIKNVASVKVLKAIKIPLPPLEEQKRIVEILDEAFAGIDQAIANTEQNLKNARELFESHLNAIFTQKDEDWKTTTFEAVCDKIQDGAHHSPQVLHQTPGEGLHPYITSKNIRNDYMITSNIQYAEACFHDSIYPRCNAEKGDILLTKDGASTGNICLNEFDEPISLLSSVCLIKTDPAQLRAAFMKYYIQSIEGYKQITGKMTGAAIRRIILRTIKSAEVHFPPIEVQDKLVQQLDLLAKNRNEIESIYQQKLADLAELKQSLLQKAFSGELTRDFRGEAA